MELHAASVCYSLWLSDSVALLDFVIISAIN